MRFSIFPSAILGLSLSFSACPASGLDQITLRNGEVVAGDVIGFRDNMIRLGVPPTVESVPIRDVHSIKFDGRIDMAAFVMKSGEIIEGDIVNYWSGKMTLASQQQIATAEVREMFLIREPILQLEGGRVDRRIGEWFVDDPERKLYAIVFERIEGQVLMRMAGRMHETKEKFVEEIEPGVKFATEGDPPDKFMKIAKNGDLELWLGRKKIAAYKPIKNSPRAQR
jgi:hypothetical protein